MQRLEARLSAVLIAFGVIAATPACKRAVEKANANEPNGAAVPAAPPDRDEAATRAVKAVGRVLPPAEPGPCDVTFEVRADKEAHSITPLIYGINHAEKDLELQRWTVLRNGGNRLTAYNWENNASNAGSDFLFQNDALLTESNEPALPLLETIDRAASIDATSVITISNADYVSADKKGGGDVRQSGKNYLTTRFKRNLPKKPTPFTATPEPTDGVVYQDELVNFLKTNRPKSKVVFSMDNEPDLWSHTHAEIFPRPVTYADLWRRNHDFAQATKAAWPEAEVLGFVGYGYLGFVSLQNAPDANGRNFVEWYLDQAKAAEKAEGRRLIDYLDVHWYPEAEGGGTRIVGDDSSPDVAAARVQAPRSLWDSKYEEKSWVRNSADGPIDLLHWLQVRIDAHYPGTKIAISEWNYGGGKHSSGSVAVADVLGILGRYNVGLATYFPMSKDEPFPLAAFRAYRNYDGNGSAFGDISIMANTTRTSTASVYASLDSSDPTRVVIVMINKASRATRAGLKLSHSSVYGTAKLFLLAGSQPSILERTTLNAVGTNAFRYEMPAYSVAVLVPQL